MDLQSLLPALGALAGGVGAYVAIRADLARLGAEVVALRDRLQAAESNIARAHVRIDSTLMPGTSAGD